MTRLEKQLQAIGINLRRFLTDAAKDGRTQYWCADQLHIDPHTVTRYAAAYDIKWPRLNRTNFDRFAFSWRGERNTITGHCKRIGITIKQAEGRRYRHGHEWRQVLEYFAGKAKQGGLRHD